MEKHTSQISYGCRVADIEVEGNVIDDYQVLAALADTHLISSQKDTHVGVGRNGAILVWQNRTASGGLSKSIQGGGAIAISGFTYKSHRFGSKINWAFERDI